MKPYTCTVERAFQLAKRCGSIHEIRIALKNAGYQQVDAHLSGRSIQADLKAVINERASVAADGTRTG